MKREPGSKAKLRDFFLHNIGTTLDSKTLQQVAGTSEWARRVRELRNEEGMNIVTHNDRSDLKPGQYLLLDLKPIPAFERGISKEIRAFVLDRNGFTCQMCGTAAGEPHPYDAGRKPGSILAIYWINPWVVPILQVTCGLSVLCVMKGLPTLP